jgi:hypothetical protein
MQLHLLDEDREVLQLLKIPLFGKLKKEAVGELQCL